MRMAYVEFHKVKKQYRMGEVTIDAPARYHL